MAGAEGGSCALRNMDKLRSGLGCMHTVASDVIRDMLLEATRGKVTSAGRLVRGKVTPRSSKGMPWRGVAL